MIFQGQNDSKPAYNVTQIIENLLLLALELELNSNDKFIDVYKAILLIDESRIIAYQKIGLYLYRLEKYTEATIYFEQYIKFNNTNHEIFFYIANSLKNQGFIDQSILYYKESLRLFKYPEGYINLASAFSDAKDRESEFSILIKVTSEFPDYALGFYNLGIYYYGTRQLEFSINSYKRCLEIDPEFHSAKLALSISLLMNKSYLEGFELHESRFGVSPNCPIRSFSSNRWYGETVSEDSTILISLEQGFGDMIQMLRYLPLLKHIFKSVFIEVQPEMKRLVQHSFPYVDVVVYPDPLPEVSHYCPLMSLPFVFKTQYESIPNTIGYLSQFTIQESKWNDDNNTKRKIGICWRGGSINPKMLHRSLDISLFNHLFRENKYNWYSLNKDLPLDEQTVLRNNSYIKDFTEEFTDFYDTYTFINNLDIVISVDTSVAHLAAGMGKPTLIILNDGFDWRWHLDDQVSAWYPNAKLIRTYDLNSLSELPYNILHNLDSFFDK